MAGELQASFQTGKTCYFLVRSRNGQIWNNTNSMLETYLTASYTSYTVLGAEQGTASAYYTGNMPTAIPPGTYNVVMKQQTGVGQFETDPTVDAGSVDWNGSNVAQLSDTATSGLVGQFSPNKLARSYQILNYPIYFKSSADHVTPFTSGIVSGQISRDGGAFGPLQSGKFTEVGRGAYSLQALTSGDLAANTIMLLFTAKGVSGGTSDPVPQGYILQRSSGFTG